MLELTKNYIRDHVADSAVIFKRGTGIYANGAFMLREMDKEAGRFVYDVDGSFGDYVTEVRLGADRVESFCSCPYPGTGCKHTVAALLDVHSILDQWKRAADSMPAPEDPYLSADEIKAQAIEDRRKRAKTEPMELTAGEMFKGQHLVQTAYGRQYTVTLHDPEKGKGHCTCPDYLTNQLGTCKHLVFATETLKKNRRFKQALAKERFPFVDLFWDSVKNGPALFAERIERLDPAIKAAIDLHFDPAGAFTGKQLADLVPLLDRIGDCKQVRVQEAVIDRIDKEMGQAQLDQLAVAAKVPDLPLSATLYPYQQKGLAFCLHKSAALLGDEMGLGKTLQAIAVALAKKQVFGFAKVLVVTMASLKEQWKREIERFSPEKAMIVAGPAAQRQAIYLDPGALFKITNYEAVLRDVTFLQRFKPDLVILDEAQRIKNFTTKTAEAVKRIPRRHALVLTGTPLENKLEDVYSIVQFLDPLLLAPLWRFAGDHFMLSRTRKGKIMGYRNLGTLHERLAPLVIRRRKEEVLEDLPEQVVNNYFVDLDIKQYEIHTGYMQALQPLINKKHLTPMDLRRIQELLLKARMVCDSTYLIDRQTQISPKIDELAHILDELVVQNRRKVVIFSEWTTMSFLIARHLSNAGIGFVELSGKIPVAKRQALIDHFTTNPECRVFLSTDAGGTGLNLQAADCVINVELPWNPARLNQRVGRVHRLGQKSRCINVVNLIAKNSLEEKIMAGLQLKTDLFQGVFDGGIDTVEFTNEKRVELLNQLRALINEEPLIPVPETRPGPEIPEDAPHFHNPQALADQAAAFDVTAEESEAGRAEPPAASIEGEPGPAPGARLDLAAQAPEKVETVLNAGMQFIGGLIEMATGQKLAPSGADQKMVQIDRQTGEVVLRFRFAV